MTAEDIDRYRKMNYEDVLKELWKKADEEGGRPLSSAESDLCDELYERQIALDRIESESTGFGGYDFSKYPIGS